jgi:purine-nucleoside phosphorylase
MPKRLRPTAEIAPDAILVGDPGRALMLAQELLEAPKMSNHARGLWGYGGETSRGDHLTIQSTGMGGPSAALVLEDLAELGVRRAIRIGTCTAIGPGSLGALLIVERAYFEPERDPRAQLPDPELNAAVAEALAPAAQESAIISLDALHHLASEPPSVGAAAADMQTASLFAAAARLGVAMAAALIVAHVGPDDLDDDGLADVAKRVGKAAVSVLSPSTLR